MQNKSIKKQLKELRGPIIEEIKKEREWQLELRKNMREETEDLEKVGEIWDRLNESIQHCNMLEKSLGEYDKLCQKNWKVSPDTLLVVAGNLLGILLVLNFEKMDIIRSKAFSMILKGRL